jgi:hypothetical protein
MYWTKADLVSISWVNIVDSNLIVLSHSEEQQVVVRGDGARKHQLDDCLHEVATHARQSLG